MKVRAEDEDTICAVSTPPGVGGIAVIRVSGPNALTFSREICGFLPEKPQSHKAYYGLCHAVLSPNASNNDSNDHWLDEVVVTYFAHGRSFTAEETIEISCHGGQVLTATLLKELITAGCRTAQPGEFTFRAFMNGRLDLVQAESVLQLIESQSRQSARVALRQLQGQLSVEFGRIEDDLVWILAQLEANIDFSAEGIEVTASKTLVERSERLLEFVLTLIRSYGRGRLLKEGLQVALIGKPNAGKSSLLNALIQEDKAIVTAIAGTTRDLVEGRLVINGVPVTFVDTAGIRETSDEIERIGIDRSRQAVRRSDISLLIVDIANREWQKDLIELRAEAGTGGWTVFNKLDLDSAGDLRKNCEATGVIGNENCFWVSAVNRTGLAELEAALTKLVDANGSETSNVVTQARHLEQLEKIETCLVAALGLMKADSSPEFIAFELQEAIRSIHELLGKEFHEQVIDRIFKEFCLGK